MPRRVKTRAVVVMHQEFPALMLPGETGKQLGFRDVREIPVRIKLFGEQFYMPLWIHLDEWWEPGDRPTGWVVYLVKNLLLSYKWYLDDEVDVELVAADHAKPKRGRRIYKPGEWPQSERGDDRVGVATVPEPSDAEVFEPWARALAKVEGRPWAKRLAKLRKQAEAAKAARIAARATRRPGRGSRR